MQKYAKLIKGRRARSISDTDLWIASNEDARCRAAHSECIATDSNLLPTTTSAKAVPRKKESLNGLTDSMLQINEHTPSNARSTLRLRYYSTSWTDTSVRTKRTESCEQKPTRLTWCMCTTQNCINHFAAPHELRLSEVCVPHGLDHRRLAGGQVQEWMPCRSVQMPWARRINYYIKRRASASARKIFKMPIVVRFNQATATTYAATCLACTY